MHSDVRDRVNTRGGSFGSTSLLDKLGAKGKANELFLVVSWGRKSKAKEEEELRAICLRTNLAHALFLVPIELSNENQNFPFLKLKD